MYRGLYDSLITEALARVLGSLSPDAAETAHLDAESAVDHLIDSVGTQLRAILSDLPGSTSSEQLLTQLALVNDLLRHIRESNPSENKTEVDPLVTPPQVLRAIYRSADPKPTSPETGLASPWLSPPAAARHPS